MTSTPHAVLRRIAAPRVRVVALATRRPELPALLALAAVLYLWALGRNGMANTYYAAAVRSMSTSWHAFLFGSFDAGGVMTVDKPPLALWVQALSVRAFGFSSWSILVPQALMGVAIVGLVYDMVARRFGRIAGSVSALVLIATPISVAISRHNNPDALLILCVTAALWCLVRGLEDGRMRWIVLSGVCVGLGFEAKMAAALLVVPAIAAAWLWVAPRGRGVALRQLIAGGGALAVVGGAWPLLVALTPAADRPWISGTSDNSIWSLIFGYNGLGRLAGQAGGPGAVGGGGGPGGFGGGGPGGGQNSLFGGPAGPLRLVQASLGGQAGWLIGIAIVAIGAMLVATRLRRGDPATGWLIGIGGAFATTAIAFSVASGIFHPYYVSALAPFTAALAGAGVSYALARERRARIVGPLLLAGGALTAIVVAHDVAGAPAWTDAVVLLAALPAALALAFPDRAAHPHRHVALAIGLAALLAAPAAWSAQTLGHATNGTFPAGGPSAQGMGGFGGGPGGFGRRRGGFGSGRFGAGTGGPGGANVVGPPPGGAFGGGSATGVPGGAFGNGRPTAPGGFGGGAFGGGDSSSQGAAVDYAKAHGGGTVVTSSQSGTSSEVIAGANIAAIGGFSGRESQVSSGWLADAVQAGRIRWVLADGGGLAGAGGFGGQRDTRVGSSDVMALVENACTSTSVSNLYDCSGKAAALRSAG
jgi:4-amino-4-deoxy-L-arabinose transferase-like glycosyltransferase